MVKYYELKAEEVRKVCPLEMLPFKTTDELEPYKEIIGQKRAVNSMQYGLQITKEGYNIYMAGAPGSGKATYAQTITQRFAKSQPVPNDWCYVYNFIHPDRPIPLAFPAGTGKQFVRQVSDLVERLKLEIPLAFESEEYDIRKNQLLSKFQGEKEELMDELEDFVQERNFILQEKKSGIVTMPTVDERPITEKEFAQLPEETKEEYHLRSEQIQEKALDIFRQIRKFERDIKEALKALSQMTGNAVVKDIFHEIFIEYEDMPKVTKYLQAFKRDVIQSLDEFREKKNNLEWALLMDEDAEPDFLRYKVNLFIDNSQLDGAPVIYETNPTFYQLMGRIEYISRVGSLVTSFMQIKPGAIHRANGGYLILNVRDLLLHPDSWQGLKRALKTSQSKIENLGENYGLVAMSAQHPGPIPLQLKVILLGSSHLYHLLMEMDQDYPELFKIKADFDPYMERSGENIIKTARFIKYYTEEEQIRSLDAGAVAELIEYSSRLTGSQQRLSTNFHKIAETVNEADTWASLENQPLIYRQNIQQAITERRKRNNRVEELIQQRFCEGTLMIETCGYRVGQVNSLVVLDFSDYAFGYPAKVTAVAYQGKGGVVHVERETKMSGAIHDKGLMILTNYLGSRYAQNEPLNVTASITFEQIYGGIDGDSASCAELIALITSIGQISVAQNIAITGSVNQKGEVQPVGSVTEKVEGFYVTCKTLGLTGDQGVIIPEANVKNLMLQPEVVQAVRKGQFHIYPIRTVDEGLEILTGISIGHLRNDGSYPRNSINYVVNERLKKFALAKKNKN